MYYHSMYCVKMPNELSNLLRCVGIPNDLWYTDLLLTVLTKYAAGKLTAYAFMLCLNVAAKVYLTFLLCCWVFGRLPVFAVSERPFLKYGVYISAFVFGCIASGRICRRIHSRPKRPSYRPSRFLFSFGKFVY